MDFSKGLILNKHKAKLNKKDKLTSGIIKYENNKFKVFLLDGLLLNVDAYKFNEVVMVYAKPNNDKQIDWNSMPFNNINEAYYSKIAKYWATIKPLMVVRGIVVNNEFIIKKYINTKQRKRRKK